MKDDFYYKKNSVKMLSQQKILDLKFFPLSLCEFWRLILAKDNAKTRFVQYAAVLVALLYYFMNSYLILLPWFRIHVSLERSYIQSSSRHYSPFICTICSNIPDPENAVVRKR